MKTTILLLISCLIVSSSVIACTIFCGKDHTGQVWAGNNEDNLLGFYNYLNVFPKTESTKYGYYTLSYHSPENGENFNIQGGMNEAGLFYDFNILDASGKEYIIKDLYRKKPFPDGDHAILSHLLANFQTVEEVVDFFDEYWFEIGFKGAQMHLADRNGHFAMIDPTGSRILSDETYQLSTNFSICGKEDTYGCWRYPIAESILEEEGVSFESFKKISERTAQRGNIATIYSNIQNLSTGEIWFYFGLDYEHPFKTDLTKLLKQGRKSYLLRDLFPNHPLSVTYQEYVDRGGVAAYEKFSSIELPNDTRTSYLAAFVNDKIGNQLDMDALPFLEEYLETDPIGHWMTGAKAITYFNKGDTSKAVETIMGYKKKYPETSMDVQAVLDKFKGVFPEDANTVIELVGHPNAKNVFVTGLPGGIYNFLLRDGNKWITKLRLPDGIFNYQFIVDGTPTLSSSLRVYENTNPFTTRTTESHRVAVNMSLEKFERTIRVQVPDANDQVYIVGSQPDLTNWSSVIRMDKISDFEREITVSLHLPTMLKFTKGNWDNEAVVEGYPINEQNSSYPPQQLERAKIEYDFNILKWTAK